MAQYEDQADAPASNTPDEFGEKPESAEVERRELYREWKQWVESAQKLRKDWEEAWKVERLENYFLGKQNTGGTGAPVFNHFGATLKSTQPELFYSNPTFLARPSPGEEPMMGDRKAAVAESLLAAISKHEDNLEEASELGTMQAHFRVGVLKVCYDPRLEPNPNAGMPMYMIDASGIPQRDPQSGEAVPLTDPATGEAQVEPDEIVSDETYRFEWVDAKNLLLPDEGPDMKRWCRIGEEVVVTLEEAKADTRFPADLREQLKSNESKDPTKRVNDDNTTHRYGDKMFRYFECYDIKKKRWCIFATGQIFDDFLVEDVFPQGIDNHPYAILRFTPIIGPEPSPWPLPETYGWLDPQTEYNTRRQQITEGCKRAARKAYYDQSTFDNEDEALKALVSSNDMEAIRITDINKPPVIIPDPNLPSDILNDVALLQTDWRIITHQTGARQGVSDANTATEAAFAERAANARTADKRKVVTRWLRSAGRKMFQLVRATMTLEMWVKIKGMGDEELQRFAAAQYGLQPEMLAMVPAIKDVLLARFGKETPVKATREMINFEADIDIVPGSIRLRTLDLERRDLLEFSKLIGQFPQLLMSLELMRRYAKHFEFLDDAVVEELYLKAQQMMMAQQANAGRQGENGQGGGPGPTAAQNQGTAMANAGTSK